MAMQMIMARGVIDYSKKKRATSSLPFGRADPLPVKYKRAEVYYEINLSGKVGSAKIIHAAIAGRAPG